MTVCVTLLCAVLSVVTCVASCPSRCECSPEQRKVRCESAGLHRIPAEVPRDTAELSVTGNTIHRLDRDAFDSLFNVTLLNLSRNDIMELGPRVFSSLLALRCLILDRNRLVLIHPEAFSVPGSPLQELDLHSALHNHTSLTDLITALRWGQLAHLLTLDLSANRLILLPPGMFAPLPNLQRLLLGNNSLVAVYNGTFSGAERLVELDLTRNMFRTFEDEGVRELERLRWVRVFLAHNPFTCSCETRGFAHWLNRSKISLADADHLRCELPIPLRGTPLRTLRDCSGDPGEGVTDLSLQTSYVLLGLVLGLVGMVFLLVVFLNRNGIKKWMTEIHEACLDVLEGYHYRYEIDSDPRLGRLQSHAPLEVDPQPGHGATRAPRAVTT